MTVLQSAIPITKILMSIQ